MLQGEPVEFSDFHRFAAIYCSKRKPFFLGEGDLLFGNLFHTREGESTSPNLRHGETLSSSNPGKRF